MEIAKINSELLIEAYNSGESMTSIAKRFGTYATTIRRILIRNNVELRHDRKKKGELYVDDGEKLIEWAKAQGRLVTKSELAKAFGKERISHSYFKKYPELGHYIKNHINVDLKKYVTIISNWLTENNIPYKPSDRTKLGVSVDFLLLGEYSNMALQIINKPRNVSQTRHEEEMSLKSTRAADAGIKLIFLDVDTDGFNAIAGRKLKHTLDEIKDGRL